jgi:hypothetical protein
MTKETEMSKKWDKLTEIAKESRSAKATRLKEYKKRYMAAYVKGEIYSIKNDPFFAKMEVPKKFEKMQKDVTKRLEGAKEVVSNFREFLEGLENKDEKLIAFLVKIEDDLEEILLKIFNLVKPS